MGNTIRDETKSFQYIKQSPYRLTSPAQVVSVTAFYRAEVMLFLDWSGLDEKAVSLPGLQGHRPNSLHGGTHARDAHAVGKGFDRHRIRIGDQMPHWEGVFVRLKRLYRNDFNRG